MLRKRTLYGTQGDDWIVRIRRDQIAWWIEVVNPRTHEVVRSVSCLWEWSARLWARSVLRRARRVHEREIYLA